MQFVKQVDITKKRLLPARIKLLNNKTQQPQNNGWLWLGQWALVMPDACPFCYGVNLAVKKPTTKPYKIQKSQHTFSFSYHTWLFHALQLLWSSTLKCFLDVCKSRIHSLYIVSAQTDCSFAPVVIVVNTSSLSCIAFLDVLNKKRNLFRPRNWNFSKGQNSQFSKGVKPRLVSKILKFFFVRFSIKKAWK